MFPSFNHEYDEWGKGIRFLWSMQASELNVTERQTSGHSVSILYHNILYCPLFMSVHIASHCHIVWCFVLGMRVWMTLLFCRICCMLFEHEQLVMYDDAPPCKAAVSIFLHSSTVPDNMLCLLPMPALCLSLETHGISLQEFLLVVFVLWSLWQPCFLCFRSFSHIQEA